MLPVHYFYFIIFSLGLQCFTLFTYFLYYGNLLTAGLKRFNNSEYDYIIVGAGTAGSVIAHRMAKETNFSFTVLEAGGYSHSLLDIPVLAPLLHGSVYDWLYETVPQRNACLAMKDNKCKLTQGKIVGGSSKLNNMIHIRGNITDYVEWFNNKYTYNYIQQQFRYVEENLLHLSELKYSTGLADAIVEAAKELDYKELAAEFALGFSKSKVSQLSGKRWSTADNLDKNIHLITNALVETILINENRAVGVQVTTSNEKMTLRANKGVILAAGTYNTPKILQLSGIGPSEILKPLKIKVIKDLPVGKNLQDHITTGMDLVSFRKPLSISIKHLVNPFNIFDYFMKGIGPFTSPGCEAVVFLSTNNSTKPNLQFMVLPVGLTSDKGSHLRNVLNVKDNVWYNYFSKLNDHTGTILPILLHPKSKGTVYIKSNKATDPPLIDPNYFSEIDDLKVIIDGLKLVKKFIETESMKSVESYMTPIPFPGCDTLEFLSDVYWECYVRHLTLTSYHPVGTCSMGTVVDSSFKIFGVNNLFIADASVMPTLPSGNINAAVAMMANMFFESNFKTPSRRVCHKNDMFIEYVFKICINM